jgi:hypothetical protein
VGKPAKKQKKEYVVECYHENRLKGLPSLQGKNSMSVISATRCYEWDDSCR